MKLCQKCQDGIWAAYGHIIETDPEVIGHLLVGDRYCEFWAHKELNKHLIYLDE